MSEALVTLVAVRDTPEGPVDVGSIDGDEVTIRVTIDGELIVSNGRGGFFGGGPSEYSLADIVDHGTPEGIRLEVRIIGGDS